LASPLVIEHEVYAGASWNVTPDFLLTLAYQHGFHNSVSGPIVTPFGSVPGSSVSISAAGDLVTLGATIKFGACRGAENAMTGSGE
jgi:outer membrane receptor protein involved in Fe transport